MFAECCSNDAFGAAWTANFDSTAAVSAATEPASKPSTGPTGIAVLFA